MQVARHFVERAFEDAKGACGMADYQVRGWQAWHHHMALVMVALMFLAKERLASRETAALLSCNDLIDILRHKLPSRIETDAELATMIADRHRRRQKAMDFAYQKQAASRCSVLIESLRDLQRERERLSDANPLPDSARLLEGIRGVNASYADERLQRSNSLGLFSAFLFFAIQGGPRYRQLETWVLKNHQYELQTINASDLIRIFEKVAESRHRQIFVSMQFKIPDKGGQWVDNPNWKAIEAAVAELNREHQFDLKLKPIRIDEFDKGYSYPISGEIFQLIEDSGYLVADLTAGNKNVYHEVGLLMGLNQARQKAHDNFLLLHNSSVGDVSKDFGFNIADFKQLRLSDTHSIGQQVKKQIAIYYGLAEQGESTK